MEPPPPAPSLPPPAPPGAIPPLLEAALAPSLGAHLPPHPTTGIPPLIATGSPWGFWATTGFGLLIVFAWFLVQVAVLLVYMVANGIPLSAADRLGADGTLLALATLAAAPAFVGLSILFASLRRGLPWREYLALRPVPARVFGWCLAATVAMIAVGDWLTHLSGRPIVPDYIEQCWHSANPALLGAAIVLAAPLGEEFFFRGFLHAGWARTWLRGPGAVLLTALLFALVHQQYDLFGVTAVFVSGLLMGLARWRTGSLWVPVSMHALQNLVAVLQAALLTQPPAGH